MRKIKSPTNIPITLRDLMQKMNGDMEAQVFVSRIWWRNILIEEIDKDLSKYHVKEYDEQKNKKQQNGDKEENTIEFTIS